MAIHTGDICRRDDGLQAIMVSYGAYETLLRARLRVGSSWLAVRLVEAPAELAPLESDSGLKSYVALVPIFAAPATLEFYAGPEGHDIFCGSREITELASKFASRYLTYRHPERARALRAVGRATAPLTLELVGVWLGEKDSSVVRVRAFSAPDAALPELALFDAAGSEHACAPILMEDQHTATARMSTWSFSVPAEVGSFVAEARLEAHPEAPAWCRVDAELLGRLRDEAFARRWGCTLDSDYPRWLAGLEAARPFPELLEAAAADELPQLSVVVRADETTTPAQLAEAVASVLEQSYPACDIQVAVPAAHVVPPELAELAAADARCQVHVVEDAGQAALMRAGLEAAGGSYVVFMSAAARMLPDALVSYATAVHASPEVDLLFADEDDADALGRPAHPVLRGSLNWGLLEARNALGHLFCVSARLLDTIELPGEEVAAACDYDLALKVAEAAERCVHIPEVLFRWKRRPADALPLPGDIVPFGATHAAGARALAAHFERLGVAVEVEAGPVPCTYQVHYLPASDAPLVSIIIPNRDHAELLERCVKSILEHTSYPSFEIVIVENNSAELATGALYEKLLATDSRVKLVAWANDDGSNDFNYAKVINYGVEEAAGSLIVTLNNDTEVISREWLDELVGLLQRPEVGVAGAQLVFADGLIQHAGVAVTRDGWLVHPNQNLRTSDLGYEATLGLTCDFSAVTGACQAFSRATFTELGGYNGELAVGFNDGDFCLRAREAGKRVVYTPAARLFHREFSTRGREVFDEALEARQEREHERFYEAHKSFLAAGDPALSPFIDISHASFELLGSTDLN